MDPSTYYITTLTNAFNKLAPALAYALAGYFIFIRLPFLLFLKNVKASKPPLETDLKVTDEATEKKLKEQENRDDFQRRMKILNGPAGNEKSEGQSQRTERAQQKRREGKKEEKKEERKREERREEPRKRPAPAKDASAENIFELKPGQQFTKDELKKKYHELLRMNHPDKVASLGQDFKKLAEQKTKDINTAYHKLKSRAS
jgi:DnaJ-domain-containing protein 1